MRMRGQTRWWTSLGLGLLLAIACLAVAESARAADDPLGGALPAAPDPEELTGDADDEGDAEPAAPPSSPEEGDATPAALRHGRTTIGVVAAGELNLRSGPGGNDEYEIITTVKRGTELEIVGEHDGWYCVRYPEGQTCYISVEAVDGAIPDTIDPEGVAVPVKGEEVQLRVRSWDRATVVGSIEGGDIVTVVGRRGQWYRILAPEAACAWVSAKYVKLVEAVELPSASAPEPGLATATGDADGEDGDDDDDGDEGEEAAARASTVGELVEKKYEPVMIDPEAIRRREEQARERLQAAVDAELERIRAETQARKREIALKYGTEEAGRAAGLGRERDDDPIGGDFTGWVEFYGYGLGRPAAYRLVKGGDVVYLLRSSAYDLDDVVNKYVAVDGQVEPAPGFEAPVMVVDALTVLDEGPFADPALGGSGEENVPYRPDPAPAGAGSDVEGAAGGEILPPLPGGDGNEATDGADAAPGSATAEPAAGAGGGVAPRPSSAGPAAGAGSEEIVITPMPDRGEVVIEE